LAYAMSVFEVGADIIRPQRQVGLTRNGQKP
jgi:hypothetical protein